MPRWTRERAVVAARAAVAGAAPAGGRRTSRSGKSRAVVDVRPGARRRGWRRSTAPRDAAQRRVGEDAHAEARPGPAKPTGAPVTRSTVSLVGERDRLAAERVPAASSRTPRDRRAPARRRSSPPAVGRRASSRSARAAAPRNARDLLDRALARRRDALERAAASAPAAAAARTLGLLDVGRVAAARRRTTIASSPDSASTWNSCDSVAADRAGVGLDRPERRGRSARRCACRRRTSPRTRGRASARVDVERVRVLHDELAPAHEAEARPHLVAELRLDLVEVHRQVAVRAHLAAHEVGDHLLVRRPEAEVAVVAVLEAQQLLAVLVPAPALLPELGRA